MKKLLAVLLISPLVLLLLVVVFILTIDPTRLAPLIQEQLAKQGIEANFGGKIAWQFFPEFGLRVQHLELASLQKDKIANKPLAQIGEVGFAVAVKPLLQREIHVTGINLDNAALFLFVDKNGHNNWSLESRPQAEANETSKTNAPLPQLKIEKLSVYNLNLEYDDSQSGTKISLNNLSLQSDNTNIEGESFPASLEFGLQLPEMPHLQSKLKTDLAFDLESLKTEAKNIDARFIALEKQKQIANIAMRGAVAHLPDNTGSKQIVNLHFDSLDLDTLLPALSSDKPAANTEEDSPLPIATLRELNNEIDLRLDHLKVADVQLNNLALTLKSSKGLINIEKLQADAFEGSLNAKGRVDATQNLLDTRLDGEANGINIGKILKDFTDSDYLAGATNTRFSISAAGATTNTLIDSLLLDSTTRAQSLVLQPINIEQQYCRILALLDEKSAAKSLLDSSSWPAFTELEPVEILASYQNSRVKMSKLQASVSSLLANASGEFNIESGEFDFPVALSLQSLGIGKSSCLNIDEKWLKRSLPLRCKGNLSSIGAKTCLPDTHLIGDILKKNLKDKADARLDEEKARLKEKAEAEKQRANERIEAERARLQAEKEKREQELEAKKQEAEEKARKKVNKEIKNLVDKL